MKPSVKICLIAFILLLLSILKFHSKMIFAKEQAEIPAKKFEITYPKNGEILSGDIIMLFAVYHGSFPNLLMLSIDSERLESSNTRPSGHGRQAQFVIPTEKYSNGKHVLTVSVGHFILDKRTVVFKNKK